MPLSNSLICDRAFEFASRTLNLCDKLYGRGPSARHIANQLCGAEPRLDQMRRKSRETTYWLRLAIKNGIDVRGRAWELSEAATAAMIRALFQLLRPRPLPSALPQSYSLIFASRCL